MKKYNRHHVVTDKFQVDDRVKDVNMSKKYLYTGGHNSFNVNTHTHTSHHTLSILYGRVKSVNSRVVTHTQVLSHEQREAASGSPLRPHGGKKRRKEEAPLYWT